MYVQVPFYWGAQFTGAICASFVLKAVIHPVTVIGVTVPTGPHWHSLVIEIIVTFNMMFVTLAVATDSRAVSSEPARAHFAYLSFCYENADSDVFSCMRRWVSWLGWLLVPQFALRPSSQGKYV